MANKEKQAENKEKIGIGAWLALIVIILVLSGAFRTAEGPIKVLDFTNLAGSFGQIPSSASSAARHPRQVRHRIHLELYRFGRCGRHDP